MNNLSYTFGLNFSNNKKQTRGLSQTKSGQNLTLMKGGKKKYIFVLEIAVIPLVHTHGLIEICLTFYIGYLKEYTKRSQ